MNHRLFIHNYGLDCLSIAVCLFWSISVKAQSYSGESNPDVPSDSTAWQPAGSLHGRHYDGLWAPDYRWNPVGMGTGYGLPYSAPLHYGLNAEVGAGVRVGWGKFNPWKGTSFFTDLGMLYALPLSKDGRWTVAVGGYYSNYRLWGEPVNRLGVTAMVDCQLNERLNLTGFVAHDFGAVNGRRTDIPPFWPSDYGLLGYGPATTVEANLGIRVTEKFALGIGIGMTRQQSDVPYRMEKHCP